MSSNGFLPCDDYNDIRHVCFMTHPDVPPHTHTPFPTPSLLLFLSVLVSPSPVSCSGPPPTSNIIHLCIGPPCVIPLSFSHLYLCHPTVPSPPPLSNPSSDSPFYYFYPLQLSVLHSPRRMLRWLVCGRLGPVWMWKALLFFVAIAFAGQLLGVIFNKRYVVLNFSLVRVNSCTSTTVDFYKEKICSKHKTLSSALVVVLLHCFS